MNTPNFPTGRKVFYFFPSGSYHQRIIKEIIRNEFEIYSLSNIKKGLPLVFQYNGAVIFFNIDEVQNYEQVKNSIKDYCRQTSQRSIDLVILSRDSSRIDDVQSFMSGLYNCSGFHLKTDPETTSETLITLLHRFNARGQRSYVRFGSNAEEVANIKFARKNKTYKGYVHDISSVGLSFSLASGSVFPVRCKIREISLDLDQTLNGLSGTITIKRKLPSGNILHVLMFDKDLSRELYERLHFIIHSSLQRQFTARLEAVAIPE